MTRDQIILVRDMFHNAGVRVAVYGDNSIIMNEDLDTVIWDDDNELIYSISRAKTSSPIAYPDPKAVAYYTVLGYDVVQYIQSNSNYTQLEEMLAEMPVNNVAREEKIKEFFKATINNRINVKPGARSMRDIAEQEPALYNAVMGEGSAEELTSTPVPDPHEYNAEYAPIAPNNVTPE